MSKSGTGLSGTNLERAADHNQRITLHAIRVNGSLTRVDLARITGLTAPAISNITRRLLNEGLIQEAGQLRGGRGYPPTSYVVAPSACYSIGINIDRDHITIVIVDFIGQTVSRRSWETAFALPAEVRSMYCKNIRGMIKEAGIDSSRLVGIGVAMPDDLGSIDLPGRPSEYLRWKDIDVPALFAEPLDLPVFLENDAAAAAMGEMQLGRGQAFRSFFYILISSALGGGLVVDGSYFRGADGRSGELGFLLADDGKGQPEQIQNFVSLSGLAHFLKKKELTLAEALASSDTEGAAQSAVDQWLDEAADKLLGPLIAVNCLINPSAVLIGGRLPTPMVERLASRLNAVLAERGSNAPVLAPVQGAALSQDAPAVGGAILPFSHYLLPSATSLWKTSETNADARSESALLASSLPT